MENKDYIKILNTLINFGIEENEELTREERFKRMQDFRSNLCYEKYEYLFLELDEYLFNENVSLSSKDTTLTTLLEFIRSYPILENNIDKFPINIQNFYNNFIDFRRILILFEQIYYCDITKTTDFADVMNMYFDFLDDLANELFIHICYLKIENLNKSILDYLNKTDFNGIKHIDNINNPELINLLKTRISDLQNNR